MAITDTDSTGYGSGELIPEVWSSETRDSYLMNLVGANIVDRSFEAQLSGRAGDTIHIDGVGGTTVAARSGFTQASNITLAVGGSLVADVMTLLTQVDLVIDTHSYKFFDLEYELDLLTDFPIMERAAERTAYVVAQNTDDDVVGLVDDLDNSVGALNTALVDSDIIRAVQYLNDADVPEEGRVALFSAAQQAELLQIDKFTNSLYSTASLTANPETGKFKGFFGTVYGVDFYMSTNVQGTNAAGHDNGMWGNEALALAIIDNQRVAQDYEITTDSHRHAVHQIYGMVEVRGGAGVFMPGK